jgi:hypothetical protein
VPDLRFQEHVTDDGERVLEAVTDFENSHVVAEGIIGECISNIKSSLDVLWEYVQEGNPSAAHKYAEPTFHAIREELEVALGMLEQIKRHDIRPKHRDCRAVMKSGSRLLARNAPTLDVFMPEVFLKDTVKLLSTMHLCLLEQTKKKDRNRIRREYVNAAKKQIHA